MLKTTVTEQKSKTSQIASQAAIAEREAAAALEGNIISDFPAWLGIVINLNDFLSYWTGWYFC